MLSLVLTEHKGFSPGETFRNCSLGSLKHHPAALPVMVVQCNILVPAPALTGGRHLWTFPRQPPQAHTWGFFLKVQSLPH